MSSKMFSKCNFLKYFGNTCACRVRSLPMSSAISDLLEVKPVGSDTTIKGWVKSIRKMKDSVFIDVNDGSCHERLQVYLSKSLTHPNLTCGSSIEVKGQLQITPKGQLELAANKLTVVGTCVVTDGYPFVPRQTYSPDYARQYLHLRPRIDTFASLLRVRDVASQAFHNHLRNRGYIGIHTPILTSNDCEGAGEVFTVKPDSESLMKSMTREGVAQDLAYFNAKAFLTVSGQMHLETIVRALSKVYTFGPTFRAENSKTRLHLSEFYMLEAEVAFVDQLDDILNVMETMIKDVTCRVLDECEEDVKALHAANKMSTTLTQLVKEPFGVITYDEAVNILNKNADQLTQSVKYGQGLGKEHELFLVKHNSGTPLFVVDWPSDIKPFYMKTTKEDPSKVSAVDLLAPEVGELCGGSVREDDYASLEAKLVDAGVEKSLAWYLELRKYGNVPTAGFGMGFERYLQFLLGIQNIKDVIPFPRWPHHLKL